MQRRTHTLYRPAACDDEQAPPFVVVEPGGPGEAHWQGRGYASEAPQAEAAPDTKAEKAPPKKASK